MKDLSNLAGERHEKLLRGYVASLPDKQARIEACWLQVQATDFSPSSMAGLRDLAHRLAGSAGSYGFDSLGEAAATLDEALDIEVPGVAQRREIGLRAADLLQALAAAADKS